MQPYRGVRSLAVGVVALAALGFSAAAHAVCYDCSSPSSCTCTTSPCAITTIWNLPAGDVVLDCTGVDVTIGGPNGRITATNGLFTLKADDLTIDGGHRIDAEATAPNSGFGIQLDLTGKLDVGGFLRASSNYGGGSIRVRATGNVSVPPAGTPPTGNGIIAEATNYGSAGGEVDIETDGDLVTANPISVDASVVGPALGGSVSLHARNITLGAKVSASGKNDDAGAIALIAESSGGVGGNIQVNEPIFAQGGGTQGNGGTVEMTADAGIVLTDAISVQGGVGPSGGQSSGGRVMLEAGPGGVQIGQDINATSGARGSENGNVSTISVESAGPITISNNVSLLTRSDANGGDGGSILLSSDADVTVGDATLDAQGHWAGPNSGSGGSIEISGCDVIVAPAATLDVRGEDAGTISLIAQSRLDVSSPSGGPTTVVNAGGQGGNAGTIDLVYRRPAQCGSDDPETGLRTDCVIGDICRGTCSTNQSVCATNQSCTVGCTQGVCQNKHCLNPDVPSCTSDATCDVCSTQGGCTTNPIIANTSFTPASPTLREQTTLARCEEEDEEEAP